MFVFSSKYFLTSTQKMLLVFTVLLNVYVTNSTSQVRIAKCDPLIFFFLPCQKAVSRYYAMGYQAPKIRKQ